MDGDEDEPDRVDQHDWRLHGHASDGRAGANDRLAYVSPRTGRAVSQSAAEPWADRLLPLPGFLLAGTRRHADWREIADGFRLAEEDLRLRGEGDYFGTRQSGLPRLKVTQIRAWARDYQAAHGRWPTAKSGLVRGDDAPVGETWATINSALWSAKRLRLTLPTLVWTPNLCLTPA